MRGGGHRAAARRRPGRARRRCCGWRRRSATADRTASGSRSIRVPASSRPGSRSSICPVAGSRSNPAPGVRCSSTTARSTTTSSCRKELADAGERFETTSDTEVVLRLLERDGLAALDRFNGQFAFAWWQPERRRLTLVRDRFGVRPLLLRAARRRHARLRLRGQGAVRVRRGRRRAGPRSGSTTSSRSGALDRRGRAFAGVEQLGPGELLVFGSGRDRRARGAGGSPRTRRRASPPRTWPSCSRQRPPAAASRRPGRRLPVRRPRLEPDQRARPAREATASCGPSRSPSTSPATTSGAIRSRSPARSGRSTTWSRSAHAEIAGALPDVVRHTETPLVRTAPVPLYLLAREVRANDLTVVITGEGADELFWGYDLFKEVAIRELSQREPERARELLAQLYPYLGAGGARRGPAWQPLPARDGGRRRSARLASDPGRGDRGRSAPSTAPSSPPELGADAGRWSGCASACRPGSTAGARLERAAWLEVTTLLEPYLLAAQGDRVAMAQRGRGPLPVPRPSRVRALGGAAGGAQARRHARQDRPPRAGRDAAPG